MPTYTIRSPDGREITIQAADETTAMRGAQEWAKANPKAAPKPVAAPRKRTLLEDISGAAANFNRNVPGADELAAGLGVGVDALSGRVRSVSDIGKSWNRNRSAQNALEVGFDKAHPNVAALSRGTGMAASAVIPVGGSANALASGGRAISAARGAVLAGTQAGITAATDRGTAQERLTAASKAVRDPITLGFGAALGGLAAQPRPAMPKAKAIPVSELKARKNAAYKAVDDSGARYSPKATDELIDGIASEARANNINPRLNPKAAAQIDALVERKGSSPSLTELDQMRREIRRNLLKSPDESERFFGQQMVNRIDDFIDNADPTAMGAGDAGDANRLVKNARLLNTRYQKTREVTNALDNAEYRAGATGSGGNTDNALRQQMDTVRKNMKGVSPEEEAALSKVIKGSGPVHNTLRTLGKLSPQGNGLMAALNLASVGGGGVAGGVPGAIFAASPAAVGMASKTISEAITRGNVDDLLRVVSTGGVADNELVALSEALAQSPVTKEVSALRRAVAARLSRGVGAQGGARQGVSVESIGGKPTEQWLRENGNP